MKRLLLITIFSLIAFLTYGQTISITTDNLEPRVGQRVDIRIDYSFLDSLIEKQIDTSFFRIRGTSGSNRRKEMIAKDTGYFVINPISLSYENHVLKSNSLRIRILPALPRKEGLWVRFSKNMGKNLIILEENKIVDLIANHYEGMTSTEIRMSENTKYAELKEKPTPEISYELWASQIIPDQPYDEKTLRVFVHSIRIYEIKCQDFNKYELDISHFENLPLQYEIPERRIK